MTCWSFHDPVRIEFGAGRLSELAGLCDFRRAVLVTTAGFTKRGVSGRIRESMGERLVGVWDAVEANPDVPLVEAATAAIRGFDADGLIALGGGSAIDTAKVVARRLCEPHPALPVCAIPTTAGTGAEVTPFATVWDFAAGRKLSVAGADLFPRVALLDPELTLSSPASVTASSGLDTVSHALESTWNRNANPASLALAARSLSLSLPALKALAAAPGDLAARTAMMEASALAGIAIAQTRTALAHAISYPLTARLGVDHGVACSFLLVELLRYNAADDDGRLRALAAAVGVNGVDELAHELAELHAVLGVGGTLAGSGVSFAGLAALTGEMFTPGRADNNLRTAGVGDVEDLLNGACRRLGLGG